MPSSVTFYSPLQTFPFSVTSTGYGSSNLTYTWGPSLYGLFEDGCGHTGATVTCDGTQTAYYYLAGNTLPLGNDTFPVQVSGPGGLSLGTIHGTVKFQELTSDRLAGLYSGTVNDGGGPIPISVGVNNTPGTTAVSFICNFNDMYTLELAGTEVGNTCVTPVAGEGNITWSVLGPDWTTLMMTQTDPDYTGLLTRATMDCPDLTGQTWNATLVVNATDCGKASYTVNNTYAITQSGFEDWLLWPYWEIFQASGSDGSALSLHANATNVQVSGSYVETIGSSTGTTTVSGQLDLSTDGSTYSGTLDWTWKGAKGSCGGTTANVCADTEITQFTANVTTDPTTGVITTSVTVASTGAAR